jgi:hypothetical protein
MGDLAAGVETATQPGVAVHESGRHGSCLRRLHFRSPLVAILLAFAIPGLGCTRESASPGWAGWSGPEVEQLAARLSRERPGDSEPELIARLRRGSRSFGPKGEFLHCLGDSCSVNHFYHLNEDCWLLTLVHSDGDRSSEHLESAEVRCGNRVLAKVDAERRPAAAPR